MRVAFHTLGCKVNQYETEKLRRDLLEAGFQEVDFSQEADLYFINTCTVTGEADRKSRQMIRRAVRTNPEARVVAAGCAAGTPGALERDLPGQVLRVPNSDKPRLGEILSEILPHAFKSRTLEPGQSARPVAFGQRTRALLKVQDGCNQRCSYCIIPSVRGSSRSRTPEEVVEEAWGLARAGYREVVLTGVHLGSYGRDLPRKDHGRWNLPRLVRTLCRRVPGPRWRLSSLEPGDFDLSLLDLMDGGPLCPHLHLPLQHASDRILRRMRRWYRLASFHRVVEEAARRIPGMGLSSDVMVGFPGETEEDFEILYRYVQESPLTRLHVFTYSPRPGTEAAGLPDPVPPDVRHQRSQRLITLGRERMEAFHRFFLGRTLAVVVEHRRHSSGLLEGVTGNYIPVLVDGPEGWMGREILAGLEEIRGDHVLARGQAR